MLTHKTPPVFDPYNRWWTHHPVKTWCIHTVLAILSITATLYLISLVFPVNNAIRANAYAAALGHSVDFGIAHTFPQWTFRNRIAFRVLIHCALIFVFIKVLILTR